MTRAAQPILVTQRPGGPYVVRWSKGDPTPITSKHTVNAIAYAAGLVVDWQHPTHCTDGRTAWTLTKGEPT